MITLGVLRFSGRGAERAQPGASFRELPAGIELHIVPDAEPRLDGIDVLVVDGCGSPERHRPAIDLLASAAGAGMPVLGVCGGFELLCQVGLLPGAVQPSAGAWASEQFCLVEGRPTPFTQAIPAGRHLPVRLPQNKGCFVHDDPAALAASGQVVLRFCTADGEVDPDRSTHDIAGVCSADGTVLGIWAHPPEPLFLSVLAFKNGFPARV